MKLHYAELKEVLRKHSIRGLTFNCKKRAFKTNKTLFFGVIFSQDRISLVPAKFKAVLEFSHQQNVKDTRSFFQNE